MITEKINRSSVEGKVLNESGFREYFKYCDLCERVMNIEIRENVSLFPNFELEIDFFFVEKFYRDVESYRYVLLNISEYSTEQ